MGSDMAFDPVSVKERLFIGIIRYLAVKKEEAE
jgi:hypothetical protein